MGSWQWSFTSAWDFVVLAVYVAGAACDGLGFYLLLDQAFGGTSRVGSLAAAGFKVHSNGPDTRTEIERATDTLRDEFGQRMAAIELVAKQQQATQEQIQQRLENVEKHLKEPSSPLRQRKAYWFVGVGIGLGVVGNVLSLGVGNGR